MCTTKSTVQYLVPVPAVKKKRSNDWLFDIDSKNQDFQSISIVENDFHRDENSLSFSAYFCSTSEQAQYIEMIYRMNNDKSLKKILKNNYFIKSYMRSKLNSSSYQTGIIMGGCW